MSDGQKKIEELLQEALLLSPFVREHALKAVRGKRLPPAQIKNLSAILQSFIVWQDKTVQAMMKSNPAIYRQLIREYNIIKGQMLTTETESQKRQDAGKLHKIKSIIQQL